jgi:hypothetical protein
MNQVSINIDKVTFKEMMRRAPELLATMEAVEAKLGY